MSGGTPKLEPWSDEDVDGYAKRIALDPWLAVTDVEREFARALYRRAAPSAGLREALEAAIAALEGLVEDRALAECNPQYPDFVSLPECPAGHPYECGGCINKRRVAGAIAQGRAALTLSKEGGDA